MSDHCPVVPPESDCHGHRRGRVRLSLRGHDSGLAIHDAAWSRRRTCRVRRPPATGSPSTRRRTAKGITTASGVAVQTGIAAADPALLPVGSVIEVGAPDPKYSGIYTVMDTGPAIKGRVIDIYMWSCYEALDFGRMPVQLTILRLGWNPESDVPKLLRAFLQAVFG